jgi:hypothetical protein
MRVRDAIDRVLEQLPEDRQRQVLDFARFIAGTREDQALREFGRQQFARAYAADEPEYTEADLRRGTEK